MQFAWWEEKRLITLRERGLDFRDAWQLFDGRPVLTHHSPRGGEYRFLTIGLLEGRCVAVVWMDRGDIRRIISMRRARNGEEKSFRALYG